MSSERASLTYTQLHDRVCRTAAGLRAIGLQPEQWVLMLMADTPEFVTVYLAAMRAGAIPVPVYLLEEIAAGPASGAVYSTIADSPVFWLYTFGTTGKAKAAMHRHGAIPAVCAGLPPVKRPRKVVFTDGYPTTATGKVRRVELRGMAAAALAPGDSPAQAVPS